MAKVPHRVISGNVGNRRKRPHLGSAPPCTFPATRTWNQHTYSGLNNSQHGESLRSSLQVMTFFLLAAALVLGSTDMVSIRDDDAFENQIIQSSHVWAVLFTSPSRAEDTQRGLQVFERVAAQVSDVRLGVVDVDEVKAFASEFNVRKRMVPRLLVFTSRARQAEMVAMKGEQLPTAEQLQAAIRSHLKENIKDADGVYQKMTLSIGVGSDDKEL